jgi:hypothetical protein
MTLSCANHEESPIIQPKPAPSSGDSITSAPLGGTLLGEPFSIQSARYSMDRRLGFEKIDVSFSLGSVEAPCGEPSPPSAPVIWLRRKGAGPLKPEAVRISPKDQAAWEVHYQVHDEHGWRGNGDASALIVIKEISPDMKLSGELWACFADATGSCVAGQFIADHCVTRLDAPVRGSETMERLPAGVADAGVNVPPTSQRALP